MDVCFSKVGKKVQKSHSSFCHNRKTGQVSNVHYLELCLITLELYLIILELYLITLELIF